MAGLAPDRDSATSMTGTSLHEPRAVQMARNVSAAMVSAAIRKGTPHWDPLNKTINYTLPAASGKTLIVDKGPTPGR